MYYMKPYSNRISSLTRQGGNRIMQGSQWNQSRPMSGAVSTAHQAKFGVVALVLGIPLVYWGYKQANLAITRMETKHGSAMIVPKTTVDDILQYRALMDARNEEDEDDDEE